MNPEFEDRRGEASAASVLAFPKGVYVKAFQDVKQN